ncbi:MAG: DUF2493 domain-containing protein, partial [Dehalococcoidia bacterium]|nr:DUF2493 domain-containing protein [Dehalococcoidia bacterium]
EGRLERVLDTIHEERGIDLVITGGCRGADAMADRWARLRHIPTQVYLADWAKHGRMAGPLRNKEMLVKGKPDIIISFPGGKGTANMVGLGRQKGLRIIEVS